MLSVVKVLLKGDIGGCALNSHGNYIVDHGKSWKNHGIVLLNFCGNSDSVSPAPSVLTLNHVYFDTVRWFRPTRVDRLSIIKSREVDKDLDQLLNLSSLWITACMFNFKE